MKLIIDESLINLVNRKGTTLEFNLDIKYCSRCKTFKHVNEFGKRISSRDGLHPRCKECNKTINLKKYESIRKSYTVKGLI